MSLIIVTVRAYHYPAHPNRIAHRITFLNTIGLKELPNNVYGDCNRLELQKETKILEKEGKESSS